MSRNKSLYQELISITRPAYIPYAFNKLYDTRYLTVESALDNPDIAESLSPPAYFVLLAGSRNKQYVDELRHVASEKGISLL